MSRLAAMDPAEAAPAARETLASVRADTDIDFPVVRAAARQAA